jgi:hypothetical protein
LSYVIDHRDDTLNELFVRYADFNMVSNNLLEAKDINSFIIWFDKLIHIDKRCLFLFLRKNKNKFINHPDWMEIAQSYFNIEI